MTVISRTIRVTSSNAAWFQPPAGAGYTDADTAQVVFTPSAVEEHVTADAATALITFTASAVENIQAVDSAAAAQITFTPSAVENAQYTEAQAAQVTFTPSAVNTLQAVDAATATVTFTPSAPDVLAAVEAATALVTFTPSAADVLAAVEAATALVTFTPSAVEIHVISDAATGLVTFTPSSVDAFGHVDAATALVVFTAIDVVVQTVLDSFSRALASGLGNDDLGNVYQTYNNTSQSGSKFATDGSTAQMILDVQSSTRTAIVGPAQANHDVRIKTQLPATPVGGAITQYLLARVQGVSDHYRIAIRSNTDGTFTQMIERVTTAGGVVAHGSASYVGPVASTYLWLRLEIINGDTPTINAYYWNDGDTEPTTPLNNWTDGSPITGIGQVGFRGFVSATNTSFPTVNWDGFSAKAYNIVDTFQGVDSGTGLVTFTPTAVEGLGHTDAATALVAFTPSATEAKNTTDAATASVTFTPDATEVYAKMYLDSATVNATYTPGGTESYVQPGDEAGTALVTFTPSGIEGKVSYDFQDSDNPTLITFTPSGDETGSSYTTFANAEVNFTPGTADAYSGTSGDTVQVFFTAGSLFELQALRDSYLVGTGEKRWTANHTPFVSPTVEKRWVGTGERRWAYTDLGRGFKDG